MRTPTGFEPEPIMPLYHAPKREAPQHDSGLSGATATRSSLSRCGGMWDFAFPGHSRVSMTVDSKLKALAEHWTGVPASERANFQSYLIQLCDALGVAAGSTL
jgi:hypothetical protein